MTLNVTPPSLPSIFSEMAAEYGLANVPQTVPELLYALHPLLTDHQIELLRYLFMNPQEFQQEANVFPPGQPNQLPQSIRNVLSTGSISGTPPAENAGPPVQAPAQQAPGAPAAAAPAAAAPAAAAAAPVTTAAAPATGAVTPIVHPVTKLAYDPAFVSAPATVGGVPSQVTRLSDQALTDMKAGPAPLINPTTITQPVDAQSERTTVTDPKTGMAYDPLFGLHDVNAINKAGGGGGYTAGVQGKI